METTISLIALIISIISGGFTLYTFWWTNRRDRKQEALNTFHCLQSEVFDNINAISKNTIKEIAKDLQSKEFTEYSHYLVRIEQFCIGINAGIYDFSITKKIAAQYLNNIYYKSLPVIEQRRKMFPDEPQCTEFESVVKKMNKGLKGVSR